MTVRWFVRLLVGGIVVTASACASGDPGPNAVVDATPATTSAVADRGGDGAVEVLAGAPGEAGAAACTAVLQTLTTAAETFEALEGNVPTDQDALVAAGLVRDASPWFEVTGDGEVVPVAGGPCA